MIPRSSFSLLGAALSRVLLVGFTIVGPSLMLSSEAKQNMCLGLVLTGGANRGAYEAGAIYSLVSHLPQEDIQYDVISGISVGALNAAHCASYPKGQEQLMSEELIQLWTNLKNKDLYQSWHPFGILNGLMSKKGLFDSTPLHKFVKDHFQGRKMHRMVHVNSVNADTGEIAWYDENTPSDLFKEGLIASSAMPFVFLPLQSGGQVYFDGGVAWNMDVSSAISKCRQVVDTESQITLDIISVDSSGSDRPAEWSQVNKTESALSNFLRYRQIKNFYRSQNNQMDIMQAYPNVTFRYIIVPKTALDATLREIDFESEIIEKLIEKGKTDALEVLNRTTSAKQEQ